MSYQLEFPPKPLPPGIRSPPYVIFGIRNVDISHELPRNIPLAMVLHFIPTMKPWVYPPPGKLPHGLISHVLRKEPIGINIPEDIDKVALFTIVSRMMQLVGIAWKPESFVISPNLLASTNLIQAWRFFGLPEGGITSVHMHVHMSVMMGGPVVLTEMKALWSLLPIRSPVLRDMAHNFIRAHIDGAYKTEDYRTVQTWIRCDNERKQFFAQFEAQYRTPVLGQSPRIVVKAGDGGSTKAPITLERNQMVRVRSATVPVGTTSEILGKNGTQKVSPHERKELESRDVAEMGRKLRRLQSDESIRSVGTVIHDPQRTPPHEEEIVVQEVETLEDSKSPPSAHRQHHSKYTEDLSHRTVVGTKSGMLSHPVDASLLTDALEKYQRLLESHENGLLHKKEKSKEGVEGDTQENNPN